MPALDLRDAARPLEPALTVPDGLGPAVIATWRGRMVNEHGSASVYDQLADALDALDQPQDAERCRTFAEEERRHGAMCGAVVQAAGGEALARVDEPRALPLHRDTTPRATALRNAIAIGCLAETVAVALIGAERLEMPDGPLRELLTRLWADEIGHARFGWDYAARLLPTLDPEEREAVARYLPIALGHLEAHELAHLSPRSWPAEGAAVGLCDGVAARELFYATVDEVVVPGLESLGLPAERAWRERRRSA